MRCRACDEELTDREATLKDRAGQFFDLCKLCLGFDTAETDEEEHYGYEEDTNL